MRPTGGLHCPRTHPHRGSRLQCAASPPKLQTRPSPFAAQAACQSHERDTAPPSPFTPCYGPVRGSHTVVHSLLCRSRRGTLSNHMSYHTWPGCALAQHQSEVYGIVRCLNLSASPGSACPPNALPVRLAMWMNLRLRKGSSAVCSWRSVNPERRRTLPDCSCAGALPSAQPATCPSAQNSTTMRDSLSALGRRGFCRKLCSRHSKRGPKCGTSRTICSRSKMWSIGQGKGSWKCEPGMTPECGAHQRSRPHHSSGITSARPSASEMAMPFRTCRIWWLASAKWPTVPLTFMEEGEGPARPSISRGRSRSKDRKPPGRSKYSSGSSHISFSRKRCRLPGVPLNWKVACTT
mmetsp:Transcript_13257/g.34345  ORF Transcript_13257/g.34345 Transcript_13257/m.34345 type:complete len:350 (-) Transcript_13257:1396-2445(-)